MLWQDHLANKNLRLTTFQAANRGQDPLFLLRIKPNSSQASKFNKEPWDTLRVWQFACWWTLSIEKIHWYGWTRKIICLHFREIESRWKWKLYWQRINAAASAPADALSSDLFNNQIITSCRRGGQTIQFQSNSSQISKSYFDSDIFIDWIWGKADPYLNEFEQQVVTWVWAWRWSGVEKHPDPPPLLLG